MESNHTLSAIEQTRSWIEHFVIPLNLCPFANKVFREQRIRYTLSSATTEKALLTTLEQELLYLNQTPSNEIDTSLLIHPHVLTDFFFYNDFLNKADDLITQLSLDGMIQIASFHPQYQFANTNSGDLENYTNRSPYPMLHLLRESSLEQAIQHYSNVDSIPENNINTMETLGDSGIKTRLAYCKQHSKSSLKL